MTWWTLTSMYLGPGHISAALNCRTSFPDHLWVAYAPWEPARHELWRMFRGSEHLCGYKYVWDTPLLQEQQLPGDTDFHLFALTDLTPLTTYWGYMFAPDGHYGNEIQGPLFHFTTTAAPPGPQPTDDPILFTLANLLPRCGNRYTWWANDTWYAMAPTTTSLTVWKLVAGAMVRQDQANEPVPPAGAISDADSRLDSSAAFIHCAYFCRVVLPNDSLFRYSTFDLSADLWALDEQICLVPATAAVSRTCSLTLDSNDIPHVVYPEKSPTLPALMYRNRIGGVWGPPEIALKRTWNYYDFPSLATASDDDTIHLAATASPFNHFYTSRPAPGGPWAAARFLQSVVFQPYNSVASATSLASVSLIAANSRVAHWDIQNGLANQPDLSAPTSRDSSMLATPDPATAIAITFRNNANQLAVLYRPPSQPWNPDFVELPEALQKVISTYNHPDVISCLLRRAGLLNVALYAFYAPWH